MDPASSHNGFSEKKQQDRPENANETKLNVQALALAGTEQTKLEQGSMGQKIVVQPNDTTSASDKKDEEEVEVKEEEERAAMHLLCTL
jgi:hypothetical protein